MSVDDIQVVLAMALYFIVVLSVGFFYLKKSNASWRLLPWAGAGSVRG